MRSKISRRAFLIGGGVGVFIAVGWVFQEPARKRLGRYITPLPDKAFRDNSPFDPHVAETLVTFLQILFGAQFTAADRNELKSRIDLLVTEDNSWRPEFEKLVDYLDDQAATPFVRLNHQDQMDVVAEIVAHDTEETESKLLALVSESERNFRTMRDHTIYRLGDIYRNSGVPWRRRGYTSWPGIPGEWKDYTRPGWPMQC